MPAGAGDAAGGGACVARHHQGAPSHLRHPHAQRRRGRRKGALVGALLVLVLVLLMSRSLLRARVCSVCVLLVRLTGRLLERVATG